MDSLSTIICSGIVTDIMEDVENIVDIEIDEIVAAHDKKKDSIGKDGGSDSVEDIIEMMEICKPFDDLDTQVITSTEINDNEDQDNPDVESNDQKLISWFDLFKETYYSWGRAQQETENSGTPDKSPFYSSEGFTDCSDINDINTQFVPPLLSFKSPDEATCTDNTKEESSGTENYDTVDGSVGEKTENQRLTEEKDVKEKTSETVEDENRKPVANEAGNIKRFLEDTNDEQPAAERMDEKKKFSDLEELGKEKNQKNVYINETLLPRKSARLNTKQYLDIGSVLKTEKVDDVKLVVRRSTRLEAARKRKVEEEEHKGCKKQKKD